MTKSAEPPVLPDHAKRCVANLVPALLGPGGSEAVPAWFPAPVAGARQVVLLVLDGLGWNQLRARSRIAPVLHAMVGGAITTVAPSTTAAALTSISTGLEPGEHGIVGYRFPVRGEILNTLRWSTPAGDARNRIQPRHTQPVPAFLGASVPVVSRAEFATSGFSGAHLAGSRMVGYRTTSSLLVEVRRLLASGERFTYVYYDGVDKIAHEHGFGEHYDAEVAFVDRLVGDLLALLPVDAALLLTADHGQVDVGERGIKSLDPTLRPFLSLQSGEGRFRWLHARAGAAAELLAATREAHQDEAWVVSIDEVLAEGWLGATVTPTARARLGDVALVARDAVSFDDPADSGPFELQCRHGSLTADEMLVPLLAGRR
jgi:hypothetical protein